MEFLHFYKPQIILLTFRQHTNLIVLKSNLSTLTDIIDRLPHKNSNSIALHLELKCNYCC